MQEFLSIPAGVTFSVLSLLERAVTTDAPPYVSVVRNLTLSRQLDEFTSLVAILYLEASNRRFFTCVSARVHMYLHAYMYVCVHVCARPHAHARPECVSTA